ncbi:hypothetical protein MMC30_009010 [Trapelia coarctata]|nr:hypothetical protein [Trapelia coarctata]
MSRPSRKSKGRLRKVFDQFSESIKNQFVMQHAPNELTTAGEHLDYMHDLAIASNLGNKYRTNQLVTTFHVKEFAATREVHEFLGSNWVTIWALLLPKVADARLRELMRSLENVKEALGFGFDGVHDRIDENNALWWVKMMPLKSKDTAQLEEQLATIEKMLKPVQMAHTQLHLWNKNLTDVTDGIIVLENVPGSHSGKRGNLDGVQAIIRMIQYGRGMLEDANDLIWRL